MKYNCNLYNKRSIGRTFKKGKNRGIGSPFKRCFGNRINNINSYCKVRRCSTTKRFNY